MKLILKRIGDDPRFIRPLDSAPVRPGLERDFRPFALCTEDGQVLPCQVSTSLNSVEGDLTTLTVVFEVDGRGLIVEGDQ